MKFIKIRDVKSPVRGNPTDSGIDFFVPNDLKSIKRTPLLSKLGEEPREMGEFEIKPGEGLLIPSWIKVILEPWKDLVFENKSWVASNKWLIIGAKVVDSSYRGEIHIHVINTSNEAMYFYAWEKLAQGIIRPVVLDTPEEITEEEYEKESNTDRGAGWFGSTWNF